MGISQPNIVFIMSDDHASHAMSCYGSRINHTPNLDRIAEGGMRFDNCFCTNSICTPSRATILAGTYNHINGVTTLATHMNNRLQTFPKLLQQAGYQTAVFGKWHLGTGPEHCPTGFDDWAVLPGQASCSQHQHCATCGCLLWGRCQVSTRLSTSFHPSHRAGCTPDI